MGMKIRGQQDESDFEFWLEIEDFDGSVAVNCSVGGDTYFLGWFELNEDGKCFFSKTEGLPEECFVVSGDAGCIKSDEDC